MLVLPCKRGAAHALAFSPDGRTLASASARSPVIYLWDLDTRAVRSELRGHYSQVVALEFAPGERALLASADSTSHFKLWNVTREREITHVFPDNSLWTFSDPIRLSFSPNGERLACTIRGRGSNGLFVWDVDRERPLRELPGMYFWTYALAFTPDGRTLATGGSDRLIYLWDLAANRRQFALQHGRKVHFLAYSPDGRTLVSASPDGMIKVWDAETGLRRTVLRGQGRFLHGVCFSPDGRSLATASGDGTIRLWDVSTGRGRTAYDFGIGAVHSIAFAPDGMRAAAGGEGQIVIWDIDDWSL